MYVYIHVHSRREREERERERERKRERVQEYFEPLLLTATASLWPPVQPRCLPLSLYLCMSTNRATVAHVVHQHLPNLSSCNKDLFPECGMDLGANMMGR